MFFLPWKKIVAGLSAFLLLIATCLLGVTRFPNSAEASTIKISISSQMPSDIPGGVANANLTKAAVFAWQEFIALNWPNKPLNNHTIKRETADTSAVFGSSTSSSIDNPLVWETLRGKAEIFPGCQRNEKATKNSPTCYIPSEPLSELEYQASEFAQSVSKGERSFPDYDELPEYNSEYSIPVHKGVLAAIPKMCSGREPTQDAWVNLDENDQVGEAYLFAGVVPTAGPVDGQETYGAYPNQQFLYLAKANRAEYDYVKDRQWNLGGDAFAAAKMATRTYIATNKKYPGLDEKFTDKQDYYVSLPNGTDDTYGDVGTVEVKSAWRQINLDEANKFHTAPVRYYTLDEAGNICYKQPDAGQWGMAALHIIHKTPSAPYFIFATFSQADNIVTADGLPVEDANGAYIDTPPTNPTNPLIAAIAKDNPSSTGSATEKAIDKGQIYQLPASGADPSDWQEFRYVDNSLPQKHESTDKRLYYTNIGYQGQYGYSPPLTPIAVDKRQHDIPPEVIGVNQAAHDAIRAYNRQHGLSDSPWLHYKLVNVQWIPSSKAEPGSIYVKDPSKGQDLDPSTYYLANEVVETDFNLKFFSGQFQPILSNGVFNAQLITDYAGATQGVYADPKGKYLNIFRDGKGFNMGGCLGCHGNAANAGSDFSYILENAGKYSKPESIGNDEAKNKKFTSTLDNAIAKYSEPK